MSRNVFLEGTGPLTLTDRDFLGAGGEADVYRNGDQALKLFRDTSRMVAAGKVAELARIDAANVLRPQRLVFDPRDRVPIGYAMRFAGDAIPLVKFFSSGFKRTRGLTQDAIFTLVNAIAGTLSQIHAGGCLVVDLNELNILVGSKLGSPWFIDTDSYRTPSFPATAVMATIRDPQVIGDGFTVLSDWFAFAILAFQLYVGIHPYKGGHPAYKPGAWLQRMADGVSVFDPDTILPPGIGGFTSIPSAHLAWFRAIFVDNKRLPPPKPSACLPLRASVVPRPAQADSRSFQVSPILEIDEEIRDIFSLFGGLYAVTARAVYRNELCLARFPAETRLVVTESEQGEPVIAVFRDGVVNFVLPDGTRVDEVPALGFFVRSGLVYTIDQTWMVSHRFTRIGGKWVRKHQIEGRPEGQATAIGDGVVFKTVLGRTWIMAPIKPGRCLYTRVPELEGYRIISARAERHLCVVLTELAGCYFRFVLFLHAGKGKVFVRCEACDYVEPNFAVLPNGVCAMLTAANHFELFTTHDRVKTYSDPPLDPSMKLVEVAGRVAFISGTRVLQLSTVQNQAMSHAN